MVGPTSQVVDGKGLTTKGQHTGKDQGIALAMPKGNPSKVWKGKYDATLSVLIDAARDHQPRPLPEVGEMADFSLWRSPRRGAMLETTNQDVPKKVIKSVNWWCKKEAAKGSEAGLPMHQVYTQVRRTLPTMLKFSKAL
jgi:hypothetical protein